MNKKIYPEINQDSRNFLARLQNLVNDAGTRQEKRSRSKQYFSNKSAIPWRSIRSSLQNSVPGKDVCHYCEMDRHRDIDHIRPKSIYPELAFRWENFVLSCTICNQNLKRDKFSILDFDGNVVDLTHFSRAETEPPHGVGCILNPRCDDGSEYFHYDPDTGFVIALGKSKENFNRASYTIDLLNLNQAIMCRSRICSWSYYCQHIEKLAEACSVNSIHSFDRLVRDISSMRHPFVLTSLLKHPDAPRTVKVGIQVVENAMGRSFNELLFG